MLFFFNYTYAYIYPFMSKFFCSEYTGAQIKKI